MTAVVLVSATADQFDRRREDFDALRLADFDFFQRRFVGEGVLRECDGGRKQDAGGSKVHDDLPDNRCA